MSMIFNVVFKRVKYYSTNSLLRIIVLASMVFSLSICFLFFGILGNLEEKAKKQFGSDVLLVPKDSEIEDKIFLFTNKPIRKYFASQQAISEVDMQDVETYSIQLYTETIANACCDVSSDARVIGFDPSSDFIVRPWSENLDNHVEDDETIVGYNVDANEGDTIKIRGYEFRVKTVLDQVGSGIDDSFFINLKMAKKIKEMPENSDKASAIYIKLKEGINPDDWAYSVNKNSSIVRAFSSSMAIRKVANNLQNLMNLIIVIVVIFSFLIILIGALLMNTDRKIKNMERRFLLTIGYNKKKFMLMDVIEVIQIATLAFLFNILIFTSISIIIQRYIADILGANFRYIQNVYIIYLVMISTLIIVSVHIIVEFIHYFIEIRKKKAGLW